MYNDLDTVEFRREVIGKVRRKKVLKKVFLLSGITVGIIILILLGSYLGFKSLFVW